jgi:hypothetical protein
MPPVRQTAHAQGATEVHADHGAAVRTAMALRADDGGAEQPNISATRYIQPGVMSLNTSRYMMPLQEAPAS